GVQVKDFAFAPAAIQVAVGETVTWMNADAIPHTSTSADKGWNSGPILPGTSFKVTFDKVGTYEYACMIHPFMHGTITVGN
ncbi:MAG TPA: plastocyanin/azurin family copper-binding protein, partial [bacterium]|nr:plastocyanin/azurin family copper-binding protein [bacterium]